MTSAVKETIHEDVQLKTTCYGCPAATCGMIARRVDGVVVEVRGDPDCPFSQGKLCAKGHAQIMMAYSRRRLTKPLKRTNPEKGIGVDPGWVEIGYEEAVAIAADKLKQCRQTDPTGLVYASTDFSTLPYFLVAILGSFGTTNYTTAGRTFCGNAVHNGLEQVHGAFHVRPDFHYCNHLMLFGSNKGAMSNWAAVTATLEMSRARRRGMKLVVVDPYCSNAAAIADEWVPIRPGTDGALVLAMMHVLVNETGLYDGLFLKTLSNAPYLVRSSDGRYARDAASGKPMMWDAQENKAKCHDDPSLSDAALEGEYQVAGEPCTPAFVLLKRHLAEYSPERAAEITTVPANTIRRLAREFGTAASIGKTVEIDGKTLPLRPACVHWYKGISQHAQSFEQGLALAMLNTVIGAIDVPGGLLGESVYAHHPKFAEFSTWMGKGSEMGEAEGILLPGRIANYAGTFPLPYPAKDVAAPNAMSAASLAPVGGTGGAFAKINVVEPKTFKDKLPHNPLVYVQVVNNDLVNEGNPKHFAEYLKKFPFVLSVVPTVDETAEFADIVIPTQTQLERLDMGANNIPDTMGATATEQNCINLRQPVIDNGQKHNLDIWMDLAEQAGFLPDFNKMANACLELQGNFQLTPQRKYTHRELTERWVGSMTGGQMSLDDVAKQGRIAWAKSVHERYPRPFHTPRIPIYYEHFLEMGNRVKSATDKLGIEWDVSRYKPLPGWYPGPAQKEHTSGFDLYAVTYKQPFKTATFSNFNAWLSELGRYHPSAGKIILNRSYAQSKGIREGDKVRAENVRGRLVEGVAVLSECIHPECVGIDHAGGNWAKSLPPRPEGADTGVHFGTLLEYETANIDNMGGGLEASPRLKISRVA